ncbi:hypothetical protein BU14_1045s0002 [Porphyra umbilicalis]|uniref:NB-ARC domain-containing protein n=1 Tax=Porphyra umbilicalis TaxID=2786 RepID=A0A1X6NMR5_PORUM|nr:hypothetical protein BU14_1045s0002 [Porphyra umbilicalis]|eukprot:OSX69875.1 hypothetical protein BU14_1045s0002 [Porphyra umbilicalis]
MGISSTKMPSPGPIYGLPAGEDTAAWATLMRPCVGHLQQIKPAGMMACVSRLTDKRTVTAMSIWLHFGVLLLEVRVFRASPAGELPAVAGRWVIELVHLPSRGDPLRFCAASEVDAREWHRQLRMRAAPLVLVWTRHVGVAGGSGGGGGGVSPALDGPAAARRLLVMDALTRGAGHLVATGALEGVAGVAEFVTEVTQKEARCVFAARVFAAAQGVFDAAAQTSADVDDLHKVCRRLLVALKDVRDDADVGAAELLHLLSRLLADVEAAAGELHHLVRSRRQRAWLACSASCRGVDSRRNASGLLDELVLALQRQTAVDTRCILAAVGPEAQLAAAARSRRNGRGVVGAHGMGGGGKTTTCLLVAHKVSLEIDGQLRFPDGVHWTQSSRHVGLGDVRAQLCHLATTLSGELVEAIDLELAIKRLRAVVQGQGVGERHGTDAESVLLTHAERGGTVKRVRRAVELCGGLPLALAVFDSLVRGYALTSPHEGGHQGSLLTKSSGVDLEYGCLSECLRASYTALREDDDDRPLRIRNFRALCVVRSKEQLPWPALAALWNVESRAAVAVIARDFHARSLVSLRGLGPGEALSLSLHDLVIDFLAGVFETDYMGHAACCSLLVERYCERNGIAAAGEKISLGRTRVALRPLWLIPPDGYVERALPHQLVASGAADELDLLLLDMRFIASRVELAGGHCGLYRSDCRYAVGVAVLDDVATVVEGAVVSTGRALSAQLQQAAWEVAVRFGSLLADGATEADRPALTYLCQSARAYLVSPFVELLGASRLLVPLERRVLPVSDCVQRMCAGFKESGGLFVVTANGPNAEATILNVWDEESEAGVTAMEGHVGGVGCLAVVGGGASGTPQLVISGAGCALRVWDTEYWSCVAVLEGHTKAVCCVTMVDACGSDTPARLVSGSRDGTVRVWDAEGWSAGSVAVLEGHTEEVTCLALEDNGQCGSRALVASGSKDKTLRWWTTTCFASPRVLSGSHDKTVRVWDVAAKSCVSVLEGHVLQVRGLEVASGRSCGKPALVVSFAYTDNVRVWNLAGRSTRVASSPHAKAINSMTGDGRRRPRLCCVHRCIALVDRNGCGVPTHVVAPMYSRLLFLDMAGTCLAECGADGRAAGRLLSASPDKTIKVWDMDSGTCLDVITFPTHAFDSVAAVGGGASGCAPYLVSIFCDGTVQVWDWQHASCLRVFTEPVSWRR